MTSTSSRTLKVSMKLSVGDSNKKQSIKAKVKVLFKCENGFPISAKPYLAGDDDVDFAAHKDLAFRCQDFQTKYTEYLQLLSYNKFQ